MSGGHDSALTTVPKMSENGGNWTAQNDEVGAGGQRGHFGRAQFGQARLQEAAAAGAIPAGNTPQQFMRRQSFRTPPRTGTSATSTSTSLAWVSIAPSASRPMEFRSRPRKWETSRISAARKALAKFIASAGHYNPSNANGTSLMDYRRLGARGSSSMQASDFRGLRRLKDRVGSRFAQGLLLYDRKDVLPFGEAGCGGNISALGRVRCHASTALSLDLLRSSMVIADGEGFSRATERSAQTPSTSSLQSERLDAVGPRQSSPSQSGADSLNFRNI